MDRAGVVGIRPEAKMTGLFREHPAGIFVLSVVLSLTGIPAAQAAYVIGIAAGLGSLLLIGGLIRRLTSDVEVGAALVLLQLMPVAFIFRVRANHEYPMLFCLLLALTGMAWIAERRPLVYGVTAVAAGLVGGLFIKGIFVALIVVALVAWILLVSTSDRSARKVCGRVHRRHARHGCGRVDLRPAVLQRHR